MEGIPSTEAETETLGRHNISSHIFFFTTILYLTLLMVFSTNSPFSFHGAVFWFSFLLWPFPLVFYFLGCPISDFSRQTCFLILQALLSDSHLLLVFTVIYKKRWPSFPVKDQRENTLGLAGQEAKSRILYRHIYNEGNQISTPFISKMQNIIMRIEYNFCNMDY